MLPSPALEVSVGVTPPLASWSRDLPWEHRLPRGFNAPLTHVMNPYGYMRHLLGHQYPPNVHPRPGRKTASWSRTTYSTRDSENSDLHCCYPLYLENGPLSATWGPAGLGMVAPMLNGKQTCASRKTAALNTKLVGLPTVQRMNIPVLEGNHSKMV